VKLNAAKLHGILGLAFRDGKGERPMRFVSLLEKRPPTSEDWILFRLSLICTAAACIALTTCESSGILGNAQLHNAITSSNAFPFQSIFYLVVFIVGGLYATGLVPCSFSVFRTLVTMHCLAFTFFSLKLIITISSGLELNHHISKSMHNGISWAAPAVGFILPLLLPTILYAILTIYVDTPLDDPQEGIESIDTDSVNAQ
jgi:hypothetical protein